jgi:hypothetical protein
MKLGENVLEECHIHMSSSPRVRKEDSTFVQDVVRLPIRRCHRTEFREEMDATINVVHRNYTCHPITVFECAAYFIHVVISFRLRLEW